MIWCAIGNNARLGGSRTEVGTYHVRVTERVRVCQKRWTRGAGGQRATPGTTPNTPAECWFVDGDDLTAALHPELELGHRVNGSFGSSVSAGSPGHHCDPVWDTNFEHWLQCQLCHRAAKLANTVHVITHWLLLSCVDFNKHFMWPVVCILFSGMYKSVMAQFRSWIGS